MAALPGQPEEVLVQPSLAQIATALVSLTFIAVLALVFDNERASDRSQTRDRTSAEVMRTAENDGRAAGLSNSALVVVTEGGRAIPEIIKNLIANVSVIE